MLGDHGALLCARAHAQRSVLAKNVIRIAGGTILALLPEDLLAEVIVHVH